jgi:hypothetical protein
MNGLVTCYLDPVVASRLGQLAVLAGSESNAVARLIEFWMTHHGETPRVQTMGDLAAKTSTQRWRSTSGDELPVGVTLEAPYKGRTYQAVVEARGIRFAGKLYQSPSAAGRAVKESVGVTGRASQTDGRAFWGVRDPITGRVVTIGQLNPRQKVDVDALLREFESLPKQV